MFDSSHGFGEIGSSVWMEPFPFREGACWSHRGSPICNSLHDRGLRLEPSAGLYDNALEIALPSHLPSITFGLINSCKVSTAQACSPTMGQEKWDQIGLLCPLMCKGALPVETFVRMHVQNSCLEILWKPAAYLWKHPIYAAYVIKSLQKDLGQKYYLNLSLLSLPPHLISWQDYSVNFTSAILTWKLQFG